MRSSLVNGCGRVTARAKDTGDAVPRCGDANGLHTFLSLDRAANGAYLGCTSNDTRRIAMTTPPDEEKPSGRASIRLGDARPEGPTADPRER